MKRLVATISAAASVFLASCFNGQEAKEPQASPTRASAIAALAAGASAPQRRILEDGKLTYEEYESSVLATVACLEAGGMAIVVPPELDVDGKTLKFSYSGGPSDTDGSAAQGVYRKCYNEYQSRVDQGWAYLQQPPESVLREARASLLRCLRDRGVAVPETLEPSDIEGLPVLAGEHYLPCLSAVQQEFGLPGFAG